MARSGKTGQRAFLAAFATCGQIAKAAKAANIDRGAHYDWLKTVEDYPARFAEACDQAGDYVEGEAVRRATEGVLEVKWYQGKAVGTKRVFSDGLVPTLLRGFKPEKYRERITAELTGPGGGPIEIVERLNAARKRRQEAAK